MADQVSLDLDRGRSISVPPFSVPGAAHLSADQSDVRSLAAIRRRAPTLSGLLQTEDRCEMDSRVDADPRDIWAPAVTPKLHFVHPIA